MNQTHHDALEAAFRRFAEAVETGDLAAYEALCAPDVPTQSELFARNSEKVRRSHWQLHLRRIEQEGDVAEVWFALCDAAGAVQEESHVVFTVERTGWALRAL